MHPTLSFYSVKCQLILLIEGRLSDATQWISLNIVNIVVLWEVELYFGTLFYHCQQFQLLAHRERPQDIVTSSKISEMGAARSVMKRNLRSPIKMQRQIDKVLDGHPTMAPKHKTTKELLDTAKEG